MVVNEDYFEERNVEIPNGGLLGYASKVVEFNGTTLYKTALLSMDELNEIQNMHASEITKEQFESVWEQAILASYENQGEN